MILSRVLSIIFRFAEFVCAAVCLGITAWFLHLHNKYGSAEPLSREIYILVWSIFSVLLSFVWLLPFTSTFMHWPVDFVISAGWFAGFGVLVNWVSRINCGRAFQWRGITRGGRCGQWRALEAFAFIGACFWLASALLSMWVRHKMTRREPVVVDRHTRRRRWV